MRKKKWKKILIWIASIIVVLGIGGLFAANYVMDKMLASLAGSLEEELLAELPTEVPGGTGQPDDSGQNSSGAPDDGNDTDNPGSQTDGSEQTGQNSNKPDQGQGSEGKPATPSQPDGGKDKDGYKAEVSVDKAKDVQEKITVAEKAKLATVFMKELSADDLKKLQELSSGGLSQAEKKEARDLILERLSPEQYDELIEIAKKYGLSQGKSYDEVSKQK
jgi:hypothetical protein